MRSRPDAAAVLATRSEPITPDSIRYLAEDHPGLPTHFKTCPNESPIARGAIGIETLRCGVRLLAGRMRGVRRTVTHSEGLPGLYLEVRLTGTSYVTSEDMDIDPITLGASQLHILGLSQHVRWRVSLPEQPLFEAVSIQFPFEFIDSIKDTDQEVASTIELALRDELSTIVPLPSAVAQTALEILAISAIPGNCRIRLEGLVLSMLADVIQLIRPQQADSQGSVTRALDVLIERSSPRLWAAAAVADHLGLSESALKRAVRYETGQSLGAYLTDKRLRSTLSLLHGPLSISDIARSVGYSSAEAFTKAFRRHFGRPPSSFRS
ncbi:MAG: helix-turn-helix transcriptional regulator [Pseudomonadota bacterium]